MVPAQQECLARVEAARQRMNAAALACQQRIDRERSERAAAERRQAEEDALRRKRMRSEDVVATARIVRQTNEALRAAVERARAGKTSLSDRMARPYIRRVADAYGLDPDVLIGPSRKLPVVIARMHLIALLAKAFPRVSLIELGRRVGRDHTTVLNSLENWRRSTGEMVRPLTVKNYRGARTRGPMRFREIEL